MGFHHELTVEGKGGCGHRGKACEVTLHNLDERWGGRVATPSGTAQGAPSVPAVAVLEDSTVRFQEELGHVSPGAKACRGESGRMHHTPRWHATARGAWLIPHPLPGPDPRTPRSGGDGSPSCRA
jgi:hypothetical protein